MERPSPSHAFTLVEMLIVMAVIAILVGIILNLSGPANKAGALHRAMSEIRAISGACEAYKADNGGYPQNATLTDPLDPVKFTDPTSATAPTYQASSLFLWQQLTGHTKDADPASSPTDVDPTQPSTGTNYAPDIFKDAMLGGTKNSATNRITKVTSIQDPFGNSYGYSTSGLAAEQAYKASLLVNGSASRPASTPGFNPSFDLWSTAGSTTAPAGGATDVHNKWVKNW